MHYTEVHFFISSSCKDGWTALFVAVRNGHLECLTALLSAGADIHVQDKVSIFIIPNLSSYTNYYYNNTINSHNTIIKVNKNFNST